MKASILVGMGLCMALAGGARASDQVGIYARIGKVVFEPDNGSPDTATRVRICGAFLLGGGDGQYAGPKSGYLYYQCAAGQEAMCRMQWKEISAHTGNTTCIGFSNRRQTPGEAMNNSKVRTDLPPTGPDTYPIVMGVIAMPNLGSEQDCMKLNGQETMHAACDAPAPADMSQPAAPQDMATGSGPPPPPKTGCVALPGAAAPGGGAVLLILLGALGARRRLAGSRRPRA